jgi:predicted Zn-dependent protease
MKALHGLTYGENTSRPRLESRTYIHPQAGIQFDIPEGFTGDVLQGGMVAASTTERTVIRYEVFNSTWTPETLALSAFGDTPPLSRGRFVEGTLQGETAHFQSMSWIFDVYTFRFKGHSHRLTVAHASRRSPSAQPEKGLLRSWKTTEPRHTQPTRIHVHEKHRQEKHRSDKKAQTWPTLPNEPNRRLTKRLSTEASN